MIFLILLELQTSPPYIELGGKCTKFNTTFIRWFGLGDELRIFESYIGIGTDVILTPFDILCIRAEICELRKYQYLGDIKFVKMSNLGLDVELITPFGKKIAPLIYFGTKYGPFDYRFPRDTVFQIVNKEFHFGFGLVFRLSKKIKAVFESQLYSNNKWWWYGEGGNTDQIQTWGFERLNLGLRYKFITLY